MVSALNKYYNVIFFICTLTVLTVLVSCTDDNFSTIINNENNYNANTASTAPVPGNNGMLLVSNISSNAATIQWTYATDNSPQEFLQYQVVVSQTLTLFSLQEIIQSGLLDENKWSAEPINQYILNNLTSGKQYYANVCVRDPDNNISLYYPVSFTTKGIIYLFNAGQYTGDLANTTYTRVVIVIPVRDAVNQLCKSALEDKYPQLPQDNVIAFVSIDGTDSIKNIPDNYHVPMDWPIYSASGSMIAYNWQDLLDGTIIDTLQDSGVCDSFWWSGSLADGSCDTGNTCNGWTSGTNDYNGSSGAHNSNDSEWISDSTYNCNNERYLLGICW